MAEYTVNGKCAFNIGLQTLYWNTGTANVYTENPVDADGVLLTGEDLTAVTVQAGDTVGDASDTTYWTTGEGPVECVLITSADAVVYSGSPFFRVEGTIVDVHPSRDQVESGRVGTIYDLDDYATSDSVTMQLGGYLAIPAEPADITGAQGTDDTAILVALLSALDGLGLITDSTTAGE